MGIISPVGNDIARAWMNIREGISGIGPVTENDFTEFATRIAGEVRDFDVEEYMSMRDARRMDRFMHYGIAAAIDAVKDAGLEVTEENGHRIGVSMGAGIGGLATLSLIHI